MIDASGCLTIEPLPSNSYGELPVSPSDYELPWNNSYRSDFTAVDVKPGVCLIGEQSSDVSMSGMFSTCSNLVSVNLSGLDTSNVTDMGGMFNYCRALKTVNMDGLDTSNVTDMGYMFNGCPSLEALGVSGWDTSHVANVEYMFSGCSSLASLDVSGWDTSNVTDMGWMFTDCSSLAVLNVSGWDTSKTTDMHNMFSGCSSLASPDISGWNTSSVANMSYMFNGCESFSLLDLSGFNTSQVTDMSYMFSHCTSLKSLDLSSFDTSNVTNMNGMFTGWGEYGGSPMALEEINLSGFNTSNTTKMKSMFGNCSKLTSLDISHFSTSNVTDMSSMFSGCSSLKSLDLSLFDTSNVADMVGLFSGCSSLASIDLSGFITSNVTDMSRMFYSCRSLDSLDLSRFDFSHVTSMDGMLYQCSGLRSISVNDGFRFVSGSYDKYQSSFPTPSGDGLTGRWVSSADGIAYEPGGVPSNVAATYTAQQEGDDARNQTGTCLWRVDGTGTLVIEPLSGKQGDLPGASYTSWPWKAASDDVRAIVVLADVVAPTNDYGMFSDLPYLKTADLSGLDTSCATNMHSMFYGCSSLQTIKLSDLSTSNVTDMGAMFYNCSSLESLDLSSFDTSRVTDMSFMFRDCSSLATLDLSGFNTSNVANMQNMFSGCSFLKELDLSSFDTGKVTKMNELFYGCRNLKTVKLGKLNTSKVTTTCAMFYECSSLESLDLSSLDTSRDLDMGFMFSGCSRLSELDLSSFDTSNVTDMESMFQSCGAAHLDLSKFNTSSVTDMSFMFNMARAQSIDLSSFDTSRVTKMSNMFGGGSSLRSVVLGGKFTFNGRDTSRMCSLPTPYFTNATGLWVSSADGKAYAPDSIPNNVAATYTAQVKGEAAKIAISKSMFTVDANAKTYTGFQVAPEVSSTTLQRGVDYTVSYGTNVNAGLGTVTITGAGSYTGTLSYSFTINKAAPSYVVPSGLSAVYGQTLGDVTLPTGFSWQDDASAKVGDVGRKTFLATYTPVDAVNYETVSGIEVDLNVTPGTLDEDDFFFDLSDAVYTGEPVVGRVSSKTLVERTDYDVAYADNVKAGTASVTVTGIGNYEGSKITKRFTIKKADPSYDVPDSISAVEGQTLGDLGLPVGFAWQDDPATGVGDVGEHSFMATFTPGDTANYNVVEDVPVTVVVTAGDDAAGWNPCGDCVWKIDGQGCLVIKPANGVSGTLENWAAKEGDREDLVPPWAPESDSIRSVKVEGKVFATCVMRMFGWCRNLESVDLSGLDTSKASLMGAMFAGCVSLKSLDLSNLDTSHARVMEGMFSGCVALEDLDLSGFDTAFAESMSNMFDSCQSLRNVKLGASFTFNGSGTERLCSLPTPWRDGSTGLWRDSGGAGLRTLRGSRRCGNVHGRLPRPRRRLEGHRGLRLEG